MAKRNKRQTRAQRVASSQGSNKPQGTSKYAQKVRAGNQMYGPGCCAHTIITERNR